MSPQSTTESIVEQAALAWLESLGWSVKHGPDIGPEGSSAERTDYGGVVLQRRLYDALWRLNSNLPAEALDDAYHKLTQPEGATLEQRNRSVHRALVDGATVEYRTASGEIRGAQARVLDFDHPDQNDFLAVNQFTVTENHHNRRPDVVLFVNGLPLAVIELKNPADEDATLRAAFNQLQTYKAEIPSLFTTNELLVVSDGMESRVGTLTAGWEWFKPWRTIAGEMLDDSDLPELEVVIKGVFTPKRFVTIVRDFVVFEDDGSGAVAKKIAGYHQYHAVQVAITETLRAADLQREHLTREFNVSHGGQPGDRRIGVVWHTQGSGKSLTMILYTGRIMREPAMENPTVVVVTDRNDLDGQLFGDFARCHEILRQPSVQAESREDMRKLLDVQAGGIVFTTIQKFLPPKGEHHPVLSQRRNIVVIADEAHRSQYDFMDGFARNLRDALPNASYIGFTGTPIELTDKNTTAVFGEYISVYDIEQAVKDQATVPIYYESRLARLALDESEKPKIDPKFQEVTEGEEIDEQEKLKTKWAQLEAVVGADRRIRLVAEDIVKHFEERLQVLKGKAMVVCMSRRIAVHLHDEIVRIRPEWYDQEDAKGFLKVVMTGSASDPVKWQQHIRNKPRREALAKRFRDPNDPFNMVIVRDMWLTGFDAPSLHTMYLDKPMRGHGLMQAIARVNRVFRDKPGGLVVDYLGLVSELKTALATYTQSGGKGKTTIDQEQAVAVMMEKYEVCCSLFHGFDWSRWRTASPTEVIQLTKGGQNHILGIGNGVERLTKAVQDLMKAFTLSVPHEKALQIREDIRFFQTVQAALVKRSGGGGHEENEVDRAIQQIVAKSIAPNGVVDIFTAAGLEKPDISILSEEFLAEVKAMPQKNLAVELLRKLLLGEIKTRQKKNVVQARSFVEMLEQTINRYHNRAVLAAEVIEELIALAKQLREAERRGEKLGLTEDELAFYDALETNDSAVKVLGDETLRVIAQELVTTLQNSVTVDWTVRENVRALLRVKVRRILKKHGYPPDKQDRAVHTVLQQAETLAQGWI